MAKVFFDSNVSDEAKKDLGIWELNEDNCYVLGLVASEWIFQNTGHYYYCCYDYNWRLSPNDRGRKCILPFTGEEFYNQESVPEGLLEIRETFLMLNQKLEAELSKENGMIPRICLMIKK